MSNKKTDNETLVSALRKLSRDIQSGDGIANACVAEAADRIEILDHKIFLLRYKQYRSEGSNHDQSVKQAKSKSN